MPSGPFRRPTATRARGKALFVQTCGACHTLADAGTTGTVGPNLDDAFLPDKQQGFAAVDDHRRRPRPDRLRRLEHRPDRPERRHDTGNDAEPPQGQDAKDVPSTSPSAPATRSAASPPRRCRSPRQLSSRLGSFGFGRSRGEIDDHVDDRDVVALARVLDDAALEPVRPPGGMGRDDDLVRGEGAERVLDRLERIAVADLALGASGPTARIASSDASRRSAAAARAPSSSETQCLSFVFSAGTTTSTSVFCPRACCLSSVSSSGPATVSFATTSSRFSPGGRGGATCFTGSSSAPRDISHQATIAPRREQEDDQPEPLVDHVRDRDQPEVADRQQQKAKGGVL